MRSPHPGGPGLSPLGRGLVVLALAGPAATFAVLKARPEWDPELGHASFHFYVVSAIAGLALVLALAVIWAARRLPDARTLFLAMGFLAMATIFLAHGLGTSPLFMTHVHHTSPSAATYEAHEYHSAEAAAEAPSLPGLDETSIARLKVVGYSAQLSLFVSALLFALATVTLPQFAATFAVRHWSRLFVVTSVALSSHVYVALFQPQLVSWLPMSEAWLKYPITFAAIAALGFAAVRFFQSYRLALLPLQAAMALGTALLLEAQVFMTWGEVWRLSWWEYHVTMLAGFVVCVGSLLAQYRLTGDLGAIIEGLFLRHHVNGIRKGDPRALVALGAAVAAKDTETSDHIERVGELAGEIGAHLGLSGERLEVLRWAGRLHDVGKIGVPDNILSKNGPLTPREFEVIKLHSPRGGNVAVRSRQLVAAATIIRAHHERMDGGGYPDGLRGEEIPLEARIVAVADVWDALTSDRPYRKALPWPAAAAILRRESGDHLDPQCVEALFHVLGIGTAESEQLTA